MLEVPREAGYLCPMMPGGGTSTMGRDLQGQSRIDLPPPALDVGPSRQQQQGGRVPINVKCWDVFSILMAVGVLAMDTALQLHLGLLERRVPVANVRADDKNSMQQSMHAPHG